MQLCLFIMLSHQQKQIYLRFIPTPKGWQHLKKGFINCQNESDYPIQADSETEDQNEAQNVWHNNRQLCRLGPASSEVEHSLCNIFIDGTVDRISCMPGFFHVRFIHNNA